MMGEKTIRLMVKAGRGNEAYGLLVGEKVRARYSVNDEMALLRQRDEKPDEFAAYYAFVEDCKTEAYREVFGENTEEEA